MKNFIEISKLLALVVLVAITGCSAEDGAIGPQGPQGIQGEQGTPGTDGQDGEDGEDGEDGNASVIFSDWIDPDWNIRDDARVKEMRIPISEVSNAELRDKTLVYMYLRQWGTPSIYPMPGRGRWSNILYEFTFGATAPGADGILVRLSATVPEDLIDLQYAASRGNRFRYVLIPESSQSGKLDYTDYDAVKTFYNLPD
ncbi:hypothetical protein [Ulvibacterium marinum]|uniref:hypothetical protein n=1 Tax=Ulvibacterium marinum TaxID=2419782 RepID=UPI0024955DAC|nr:hypothetical protein [Ulvibacterium marinum]